MVRPLDLNLLRVFEAVVRHGSASGAARELGVTASAVSHALARLRRTIGDELFVPGPLGLEPTPRALALVPEIRGGLERIAAAVAPQAFDPATLARTFCVAASDYVASVIIPPLIEHLLVCAPAVRVCVFPSGRLDPVRQIDDGRVDLFIGWVRTVPSRMRRRVVAIEEEALVVRPGHPLAGGEATLARLLEFRHVVVEITGSEGSAQDGFIDERGLGRRNWIERLLIEKGAAHRLDAAVGAMMPGYLPVIRTIARTDMIATLPRRLAADLAAAGMLATLSLPYEPLRVPIEAVWAARGDVDAGLQWLVGCIGELMHEPD